MSFTVNSVNIIISAFAIFVYGALFLIVTLSRPQTQPRRIFRIYLTGMIIWSLSSLFIFIELWNVLFWFRVMIASAIGSMMGIFQFVQVMLTRRRTWASWVYLYGIVAIVIIVSTNLVIADAFVDAQGVHYSYSPFMTLVAGPGYLLTIFSLVELIGGFRKADDPVQRNRLRYLILGLAMIILVSLINWTPLGKYAIDIAGNGLSALVITYSILRHQLLDIEVIIRKSLLYFVPTTIIGASYFLIISLALQIFHVTTNLQLFLVSIVVAILTAMIMVPLRDKAQAWVDKLFFREKYDSGLMLQRVSRTAATFLEVNMLANMILDEVATTLHIEKAAFFLKDNPTKEFRLITHRNLGKNTNIRLRPDHPIAIHLNSADSALSRRDTEILPQFKSLWGQEKDILDRISADLYVPLKTQGNLIGILAVGEKRSEQPYSQDDQATLITLANQTAVAIENARLYTVEQTRRKELDSLYELSRELIATDEMTMVLERIVEHALDSIHVTFTRILLREEGGVFVCHAIHPVFGLDYDLGPGKKDSKSINGFYEQVLNTNEPMVVDRNKLSLTYEERVALFLDHVHSVCLCPLSIGGEPIGILILGERRHTSRESFDADKLRLAKAIADQASSAIQRARLHEQLEESFVQTVIALANAIDARDSYTSDHGERLSRIAMATAQKLECNAEQIQSIRWAMHLHDIGKIGVPDNILQKPGPLTDEEWAMMKLHPEIGAKIVAPVKRMSNVAPLIRAHHERYDGNGYPDHLKKDKIPLGARILTVVDSYGAIIDRRVYRKARTHDEALTEIKRCIGTQFDPHVTEAFMEIIEEYRKNGDIEHQE